MRARYPHSPLSLDEALQRGAREPEAAGQRDSGPAFWTELPGNLRAPSRARAAVRQVLASWGMSSLTPDAQLLASELVTNAVEHGDGRPIGLTIRRHAEPGAAAGILCQVTDTAPGRPRMRAIQPASERGRGLQIVAALAADHGVTANPCGKTTWFTLATPTIAHPEPELEAGA